VYTQIIKETQVENNDFVNKNWKLCLQLVRFIYNDGYKEEGYRFVWINTDYDSQKYRDHKNMLIPSIKMIENLISQAKNEEWEKHKENL